jgi:NAD(P)-dependent dehydrogenase (short-subunit alcohol dehydrogenase family)
MTFTPFPPATPRDAFDLTGRRALVTGASRGIGRAIALAFAQRGADVVVVARSQAGLEETINLATGAAGQVHVHVADLSSSEAIDTTVAATTLALGGLDILVNNAAGDHAGPIESTSVSDWQRVLHLNLQSCWEMTRAASPYLQEGGGKVINIASILGLAAIKSNSAYIAAKHGLIGLTRAVALEWARRSVQVNAIAPGFIETAMLGDLDNEFMQFIRSSTPQGRCGQPDEIAWPAVFLASSASDFMTGQVLVVDGGYLAQ